MTTKHISAIRNISMLKTGSMRLCAWELGTVLPKLLVFKGDLEGYVWIPTICQIFISTLTRKTMSMLISRVKVVTLAKYRES